MTVEAAVKMHSGLTVQDASSKRPRFDPITVQRQPLSSPLLPLARAKKILSLSVDSPRAREMCGTCPALPPRSARSARGAERPDLEAAPARSAANRRRLWNALGSAELYGQDSPYSGV